VHHSLGPFLSSLLAWAAWQPVVRLAGRLCVYPGIPSLFISLLHATTPYLPLPPASSKPYRRLVKTQRPESSIAPFLTALQAEVKAEAIRIGSCRSLLRFPFSLLLLSPPSRLNPLPALCLPGSGNPCRKVRLTRSLLPALLRRADPAFGIGVTVSLIGKDLGRLKELEQRVRRAPSRLASLGLSQPGTREPWADSLCIISWVQVVEVLDGTLVEVDDTA
jgi:molybdopterin-biosynthesis enzyme MoeA-like protein